MKTNYLSIVYGFAVLTLGSSVFAQKADKPRPNILWITSEDNGPHLGCYGDNYSTSPNIDGLAKKSLIYLNAWSTAPVCAPARTTLISGIYPPSTGSQHMRSQTSLPAAFKMYPQYLREAGYYCTNNSKEDYNLTKPGKVWDESSRNAHWKNRADGQPFFAVFNYTVSHESQIRRRPHKAVHDPAKVRVPAYHPDTPEVRQDWAQYYDKITEMDKQVGESLKELAEAGLAEDTIIFYYGDHGSGMPRNKRWTYNSGLLVPLVVHIPEKFKHLRPKDYRAGGKTDRLVGFIDFTPTLLSLAEIEPPGHMQGFAFAGKFEAPAQPFIYGFRDRMDERYDMVRSVRDKRYIYVRNYKRHKEWGQFIQYMFQTPTTRKWKELFDAGKLNAAQSLFWQTKPMEELYDLKADPDEVKNLANSPAHAEIKKKLRKAQQALAMRIKDLGFLPEGEIHSRSKGSTPYEMGHDPASYDIKTVMEAAELASDFRPENYKRLKELSGSADSAVRYWVALGVLMRGKALVSEVHDDLRFVIETDESPYVRIIAAEALGRYGSEEDTVAALKVLMKEADMSQTNVFRSMLACNALDAMDGRAKPAMEAIKQLPRGDQKKTPRVGGYVPNLINKTLADLKK